MNLKEKQKSKNINIKKIVKATKENGITLVALIITIVIILILAGITIATINNTSLFEKTKKAKITQIEGECKEKINLDISEIRISNDNINKTIDLKLLDEQLPIVDPNIDLDDFKNGDTKLTGRYNYKGGKYIYNFTINENLDVLGTAVKTGLFKITVDSVTTKSANVTLKNTNTLSNIQDYTYVFKAKNPNASRKYTNVLPNVNPFSDAKLVSGTAYSVYALAYDNNGECYKSNTVDITTQGMPTDEEIKQGAIKFSDAIWANTKASIVISTSTNYTIQYQVVAQGEKLTDTWTNGASTKNDTTDKYEVTVSDLSHGNIVYARLSDGEGNNSKYTSTKIIDNNAPTIASIDVESTTTTSIKVKASASDAESGIASYSFYIKETSADSYPTDPAVWRSRWYLCLPLEKP